MSYRKIAELGISMINKANQHHQMPTSAFELMNTSYENAIYSVNFSTDRPQHVDFLKGLAMKIPYSSKVNAIAHDPFVEENLRYEFRNYDRILVNSNMKTDIDSGNPIFYERNEKTLLKQTGGSLVYDKHIKNAVNNLSGRFKERGPYITDCSWFQGGAGHGAFRKWLFGPEFGLKNIVILSSDGFDVDDPTTKLCMFNGEVGYDGDITVIDYKTKSEFSYDFRKIGYVLPEKELATLLPPIQTDTIYKWERTSIDMKFDKEENIIKGPKEVNGGSVKVLKRLLLDAEPEYYYTNPEYITDWTDSDKERVVTRYQPATQKSDGDGGRLWYKIAVGTVVEPGVIIPGGFWFTYTVVETGTGEKHLRHLQSDEVTAILKKTRKSKSLHTPQTVWIPYATEFSGWTQEQKDILNEL